MTTHLVWFRQDLRLHDNLALAAACRNSSARVRRITCRRVRLNLSMLN